MTLVDEDDIPFGAAYNKQGVLVGLYFTLRFWKFWICNDIGLEA
jgi:hypothetical protein